MKDLNAQQYDLWKLAVHGSNVGAAVKFASTSVRVVGYSNTKLDACYIGKTARQLAIAHNVQ
jgi:hypothetical protein